MVCGCGDAMARRERHGRWKPYAVEKETGDGSVLWAVLTVWVRRRRAPTSQAVGGDRRARAGVIAGPCPGPLLVDRIQPLCLLLSFQIELFPVTNVVLDIFLILSLLAQLSVRCDGRNF
jgi:hypothetical protein